MATTTATRRMLTVLALAGATGVAPLAGLAYAEDDGSGGKTQGRSHSNPDGGGVDKPYGADGQAARSQGSSDWDGNNGCGNDDDREDDNNGNCGGPKKSKSRVQSDRADDHRSESGGRHSFSGVAGTTTTTDSTVHAGTRFGTTVYDGVVYDGAPNLGVVAGERFARAQVLGVSMTRSAPATAAAPAAVLGAAETRGGVLPLTGNTAPLHLAVMVGGIMVLAGGSTVVVARARS